MWFRQPHVIDASIIIQRDVADVFGYYRDLTNMPRFLGDVVAVEPRGADTYQWTIRGPWRMRGHWTVRVTECRENVLIRYETVAPRWRRVTWEVRFASGPECGETRVREILRLPFGWFGMRIMALLGKHPVVEVGDNLKRLKEVLETGRVLSYRRAVPGSCPSAWTRLL